MKGGGGAAIAIWAMPKSRVQFFQWGFPKTLSHSITQKASHSDTQTLDRTPTRKKKNVMSQDQVIVFHFQILWLLFSFSLSLLDAIVIVTYA